MVAGRRKAMANEPRIAPLDADAASGPLKDIVENQRKVWGKPLLPYLLYGRSPAVLQATTAMWATIHGLKRVDAKLKTLVNRRVAWWNGCPF
jgi:hypothetical protein